MCDIIQDTINLAILKNIEDNKYNITVNNLLVVFNK